MKYLVTIILATALLLPLAGCTDVEDYGSKLTSAPKQAENAQLLANQAGLQQSAQSFKVLNGRYPESLEELKQSSGMDVDISHFDYDPSTGKVTIRQ